MLRGSANGAHVLEGEDLSGVAVTVVRAVISGLERAGGDSRGPREATGLTFSQLQQRGRRISWATFIAVSEEVERAAAPLGGMATIAPQMVRAWPEIAAIASVFLSPERFYRFFLTTMGWAYPMVSYDSQPQPDGRERLTLRLDEGELDSSSFFRVSREMLGCFASFVGQPVVQVDATIGPREAVLEFVMPPSGTLGAWAARTSSALHRSALEFLQELELEVSPDGGQAAELTPPQRQVLELIRRGCDTAAMSAALGWTAAEVEARTAEVVRSSGVRSRLELEAKLQAEGRAR